jgi:hypothetical protein
MDPALILFYHCCRCDNVNGKTAKEIREGQGKMAELTERKVAAEDQPKRVDLRAPARYRPRSHS